MADRELTIHEKVGTNIQNKITGSMGHIKLIIFGGYLVHFVTDNTEKFIPYNDLNDYLVIE